MTEFQAALLLVQLDRLKEQTELREQNTKLLENGISAIEGISLLTRDERITTQASYHFVFRFHRERFNGVRRDAFVAALSAEGIPCDGRFYESVSNLPFLPSSDRFLRSRSKRMTTVQRGTRVRSIGMASALSLGSIAI